MITIVTKNETRNENLINYFIITIDKHFDHKYYKVDKKKIVNYTINDRIIIIVYKIIDFHFNNFN